MKKAYNINNILKLTGATAICLGTLLYAASGSKDHSKIKTKSTADTDVIKTGCSTIKITDLDDYSSSDKERKKDITPDDLSNFFCYISSEENSEEKYKIHFDKEIMKDGWGGVVYFCKDKLKDYNNLKMIVEQEDITAFDIEAQPKTTEKGITYRDRIYLPENKRYEIDTDLRKLIKNNNGLEDIIELKITTQKRSIKYQKGSIKVYDLMLE